MATFAEMWDAVLEFMVETYGDISTLYNSAGYHNRHIDTDTIYAYLSGRFPDAPMSRCFRVVQEICSFCNSMESVYPYPDGEYWTIGELEKYVAWRDNR